MAIERTTGEGREDLHSILAHRDRGIGKTRKCEDGKIERMKRRWVDFIQHEEVSGYETWVTPRTHTLGLNVNHRRNEGRQGKG